MLHIILPSSYLSVISSISKLEENRRQSGNQKYTFKVDWIWYECIKMYKKQMKPWITKCKDLRASLIFRKAKTKSIKLSRNPIMSVFPHMHGFEQLLVKVYNQNGRNKERKEVERFLQYQRIKVKSLTSCPRGKAKINLILAITPATKPFRRTFISWCMFFILEMCESPSAGPRGVLHLCNDQLRHLI